MHPDEKKAIAEKANGDKAEETRLTQAACYAVQCWAEYSPNSDEYAANYVSPQQAAQLGPELRWVKSQSASGGLFIYTLPQQWADSASSQTSMAVRGAQNLADQFATLMKRDAQGKIAESPSSLIIQGVANGLSAVAGWSGFEPPTGTAPVLVNSAGGQVTGAPTLGQPGYVPSNATLNNGSDGPSADNGGGKATSTSNGTSNGGKAANDVGAAREQAVADAVQGERSGEIIRTSRGNTDIDVVDTAGNLYAVGGPAKAKNPGSFVQSLMIYSETAAARGVDAYFYYAEGTPQSVIDAASKVLGPKFVKPIP